VGTIDRAADRSTRAGIFVVVAAYNEADRIGATLAALARTFPEAPVWVADDGSSDATAQIARDAGAEVVRSERVIGKGEAVTAGARKALRRSRQSAAHDYDGPSVFVLCDGDLGDSASELGPLADAVARGEADVAVAAFARRLGGGFGLALEDVLPFAHGFGMEIGMTIDAVRAGHRLLEIELDLSHRASRRTAAGFVHRARQLVDFVRAYLGRR
jgi:glycosyltransferase involved in cell wall biosynthesis